MIEMIELFSEDDYSPIISIWERSVKATHYFLTEDDFEFYRQNISTFLSQVSIYIYEGSDGIIKGFLGVSDGNIEMLFVDSTYLSEGIGKELLLYAIDNLNLKKVDVNKQNIKALEFYKKFNFKVINLSDTDAFGKPYPILHLELS